MLTQKKIFVFVTFLIWVNAGLMYVLTEQFLQGSVPLKHLLGLRLLNEEILFMSSQRSSIKEVNDWGP